MEELIVVLIGLGVVGAASRVRLLRPMAKVLIKTGLTVSTMTATASAAITEQASAMVAHVRADHASGTIAEGAAIHEAASVGPVVPGWLDNTDLLQIDGIGPKVSGHLQHAGIATITQLAAAHVQKLQEILDAAGPRFGAIDSSTWPEQAQALLANGQT